MFLPSLLVLLSLLGQQEEKKPSRKPVLIRVDPGAEAAEAEKIPNPQEARQHVQIGDFYYKRDNYKAASVRYREAIHNDPKWTKAYEKLIRTLEKQRAYEEAILVCKQFTDTNPFSEEVERFQTWAETLRKREKKETKKSVPKSLPTGP